MTFLDAILLSDDPERDFDCAIENWHTDGKSEQSVFDALGVNQDEYDYIVAFGVKAFVESYTSL